MRKTIVALSLAALLGSPVLAGAAFAQTTQPAAPAASDPATPAPAKPAHHKKMAKATHKKTVHKKAPSSESTGSTQPAQ